MGANLVSISFADAPRSQIVADWQARVQESLHESGHSYSGEIGMFGGMQIVWKDLNLASRDDADTLLDEKHEKWNAPWAVSYTHNGKKRWLVGGWVSC